MRNLLFCFVMPVLAFSQPRLVLKPANAMDFGLMRAGEILRDSVSIFNAGSDTLVISGMKPSCGCTAVLVSENKIAPRKAGTLRITFNSFNQKGKVSKSISIASNDPKEPAVDLVFRVDVAVSVDVTPDYLVFPNMKKGRTSQQTIKITNRSPSPLHLQSVENSVQGLTLALPTKPIPRDSSASLKAFFVSQKAGPLKGVLTLHTSDSLMPAIEIRVYGSVQE